MKNSMTAAEEHSSPNSEYQPREGLEFDSVDDAFVFYNNYGRVMGFSVRKQYANKSKKDKTVITSVRFVCSKEGIRRIDKRDVDTNKSRAHTRIDCPARMAVMRSENGKYRCNLFVENHNHDLHLPSTTHLMRSQRNISAVQAFEIEMADDSGIRPRLSFEYMGRQAGGRENLGFTNIDYKNYLRTKRQNEMEKGEAGSVVNYFAEKSNLNPSFTYSIQLDSEEQMTNIFWADAQMKLDYAQFGDVITFDTTFGTNNKYRPFGVFTGFNHHRGIIIFGAALLYDETTTSFKWLFEKFIACHGGKHPITIFTDQDVAMGIAISEVFSGTWHGLCTWHIMQNGIKHLGNLMKDGSCFLADLKKCIFHYDEIFQFEQAWQKLRTDYPVEKSSWLDHIYGLKEKWTKCFMKKTFTLGMRSTQLSESLNSDLKAYLKAELNILRFFENFERVVNDKRANEVKSEFDARNKVPRNVLPRAPILKQAGEVYTPLIFELFQEEYMSKEACYIKGNNQSSDLHEYIVAIFDEEGEFNVLYNPSEQLIQCSCRKFESFGILCCHALKVLDMLDIKCIPEFYFLRRWTRAARSFVVEDAKGKEIHSDVQRDCTSHYRFLCPKVVNLAVEASKTKEGFEYLKNVIEECQKKIPTFAINSPSLASSVEADDVNNILHKAKGVKKKVKNHIGGKRKKSWVETQRKRGKKCVKQNSLSVCSNQSACVASNSVQCINPATVYPDVVENISFTQLLMETHDFSMGLQPSSQASTCQQFQYKE